MKNNLTYEDAKQFIKELPLFAQIWKQNINDYEGFRNFKDNYVQESCEGAIYYDKQNGYFPNCYTYTFNVNDNYKMCTSSKDFTPLHIDKPEIKSLDGKNFVRIYTVVCCTDWSERYDVYQERENGSITLKLNKVDKAGKEGEQAGKEGKLVSTDSASNRGIVNGMSIDNGENDIFGIDIEVEQGSQKADDKQKKGKNTSDIPKYNMFYISAGQLHRVLARFQQYKSFRDPNPLVRSFLIPEDYFKKLIANSIAQDNSKEFRKSNHIVDDHIYYNQFGICSAEVQAFQENIKPGSLITYGDNIDSVNLTTAGQYKYIREMSRRIHGFPLNVWPIGEEWCFASHITSFMDFLTCGFLDNIEDSRLLQDLGKLIYSAFQRHKYFLQEKYPIKQKCQKKIVNWWTKKIGTFRDERKEIKDCINYGKEVHPPKPSTKWYNTVKPNYDEYHKDIEFQQNRGILMKAQKKFYKKLLSLGWEIHNIGDLNAKNAAEKEFVAFIVSDILNDILIYKGFHKDSLKVLLNT